MEYVILGIIGRLGDLFLYGKIIHKDNITLCPNGTAYKLEFDTCGVVWMHQIELLISAIDSASNSSPTYDYHVKRNSVLISNTVTIFIEFKEK